MFSKEAKKFLMNYLSTPSPTGQEIEGQKKWIEYVKPLVDSVYVDAYGSAIAVVNEEAEFKVVLEAHADEIGWNVNYISDDGFIYVNRNGGSDNAIAASKVVDIHTKDCIVKGIFGQTAIHMRDRSGDEKVPKVEELFIDVGAKTKGQVLDMGIHVGCKITYPDTPFIMNNNRLVGRALDNRIGGFMIAEALRILNPKESKLDFGLYIVNSVQEEIGLRGAEMVANRIKPDISIVTDVCHDTNTPGIDKKKHGDTMIGNGPVIAYAPPIQNNLRDFILETAKDRNIDVQRLVSSSSSGTDADSFAYANGGAPTALIKIPLRYMHTTVETAHIGDIEKAIKLMAHTVFGLKDRKDFNYY